HASVAAKASVAHGVRGVIGPAGIHVLDALLVARQVRHGAPEIFAGSRYVETGNVGLSSVLKQPAHDVPSRQPIGLFRLSEIDAVAPELFGDAAAAVAALREYGVIGDAGRTDLPRLAKLDDRFAENWHGPAEPLAWPVVFVCGELVHENETVARIEFAVRSFAAWRFRDDVGHARRGAAEVMRQIRCPAARDGIPRVDGVAA